MPRAGYPHAGQIDDLVNNSEADAIGVSDSRCVRTSGRYMIPTLSLPTATGYPVILLLTLVSLPFLQTHPEFEFNGANDSEVTDVKRIRPRVRGRILR